MYDIFVVCFSCLNQCSYCKTKHARGELGSYQPDDIVNRAVQAFNGKNHVSYNLINLGKLHLFILMDLI